MFAQALLALIMLLAQPADQTVPAKKGARLEVNSFSGSVEVKVWDRDAVKVEAPDSDGDAVDVRATDHAVVVRGSRRGMPRAVDYVITVPSWMPVNIAGTMLDVKISGAGSDVSVETIGGDITVRGGSGVVRLRSMQGRISVEGTKGRVDARTYTRGIHVADVSGDVTAEALNGEIVLEHVDSASVDLSTINGPITYDGSIKDKGTYRLTTHNGFIDVAIAEQANATMTVRTYRGDFRSSIPVKLEDPDARRRTITMGTGSARVELESFNGTVSLRRPGEPRGERVRGAGADGRDRSRTGRDPRD
jgi:DUF4097 and DUF4098 domain-containing protein YvlB